MYSQPRSKLARLLLRKVLVPDFTVSKVRNIVAHTIASSLDNLLFYRITHIPAPERWSDYGDTQHLGLIQINSTNICARVKALETEKRLQGISLHRNHL